MSVFTSESNSAPRVFAPVRFASRKTSGPIWVDPLLHDFVLAATLNPSVVAIRQGEPFEVDVDGDRVVHRPALVVLRETGTSVIDVMRGGRHDLRRAVACAVRARGETYELRRPGANPGLALRARTVWAHHDRHVSAGDQFRVLDFLTDNPAPIWQAERVVKAADPRGVVYALACLDLIEIDLVVAPLTPDTLVRRRRRTSPP